MFLVNWYNSPYSDGNEIETMIDKGDSVWIFTDTLPRNWTVAGNKKLNRLTIVEKGFSNHKRK